MLKLNSAHRSMLFLCLLLCLAGILGRVAPVMENFSPVGALALFAGAFLPTRRHAFWLPFAALLLGDVAVSLVKGYELWTQSGVFAAQRLFDLTALTLVVMIGFAMRGSRTLAKAAFSPVAGAAGSVLFFLVSNFGVWVTSQWGLVVGLEYAPDLGGLLSCYSMGLPFFRGTLLGDVFYAVAFFGMAAALELRLKTASVRS